MSGKKSLTLLLDFFITRIEALTLRNLNMPACEAIEVVSSTPLNPKQRSLMHKDFITAVRKSDRSAILRFSKNSNLDPNLRNGTPLLEALSQADFEVVKLLISLGARISTAHCRQLLRLEADSFNLSELPEFQNAIYNMPLEEKNKLLVLAASKGHLELVKILLDKKLNQNGIADVHTDKSSALGFASESGHFEVVKFLLDKEIHGDNIPDLAARKHGAIRAAAANGHLEIFKYLLNICIEQKNLQQIYLATQTWDTPPLESALSLAAYNGQLEIVKCLTDPNQYGIKINNIQLEVDQAFIAASAQGQIEIVRYLIDKDSNCTNKANIHAMHDLALRNAAEHGHLEVVKYLLDKSIHGENIADINAKDNLPVQLASLGGHLEIVKFLLDKNIHEGKIANIYTARIPLIFYAVNSGKLELAKFLLSKHIEDNHEPDILIKKLDLLNLTASNGHLEAVQFLIDTHIDQNSGANLPELINGAISSAASGDHLNIVKFLLAKTIRERDTAKLHSTIAKSIGKVIFAIKCKNLSDPHFDDNSNMLDYLLLQSAIHEDTDSFKDLLRCFNLPKFQLAFDAVENVIRENDSVIKTPLLAILWMQCDKAAELLLGESEQTKALSFRFFQQELKRINALPQPQNALLSLLESLDGLENIKDIINQLSDALILGMEQELDPQKLQLNSEQIKAIASVTYQDALEILLAENSDHPRSLSELARWNRYCHRADKRLPAELRPLLNGLSWDKLFEDTTIGEYTVCCLDSQRQLEIEGSKESLDHCVGNGSYAQACAGGTTQIISIRNGKSLATIELNKTTDGSALFEAPDGSGWKLKQIKSENDNEASFEAKDVWQQFVSKIKKKEIKLYSPEPTISEIDNQVPAICSRTGIYPGESCDGILEHYLGLYLSNEDGSRSPLIRPNSLVWELARLPN